MIQILLIGSRGRIILWSHFNYLFLQVAEEFLSQVVNDSNDQVSAKLGGKAQEAELTNLSE